MTVVETHSLVWLDPRELAEHPRNVRTDLGDLTGLTESVRASGVIEPLTVVELADGGHRIVDGHRRTAAAIAAERPLVPAIIRADLARDDEDKAVAAQHVGTMISTAVHRKDLSAVEIGRGVQQMLELGMKVPQVAKSTGLDRKRVELAAGVAGLDEPTAAAIAAGGLDLEQAAVVAQYADDPDTTADLVAAAAEGTGTFAHAATRAAQDRESREAYLAKVAELKAAGRTIVDEASSYGSTKNRTLVSLRQDGKELTAEAHAACPGSAVAVYENWNGPLVRELCTDFRKYGHTDPYKDDQKPKPSTPEEKNAARDERRQLIEDNKAMAAANKTRREWIRTALLERRRGEKDVLRFAVEAMTVYNRQLRGWLDSYQPDDAAMIRGDLGLQPAWKSRVDADAPKTLTSGEAVTDARLPLQLLAHVAAAIEITIPKDAHRWAGHQRGELVTWLQFLAGQGYTLSAIEQRVVDAAAKATT